MSGQGPSWGPDSGSVKLLWPGGPVLTLILNLRIVLTQTRLREVSVFFVFFHIYVKYGDGFYSVGIFFFEG